jgi:hypothetical protein
LTEAFAKSGAVDLGSGDVALLNYAYALEQLEAAFSCPPGHGYLTIDAKPRSTIIFCGIG